MLQAVGLIWGYIIQQFSQTVYILGAGFVLACIVSIEVQYASFLYNRPTDTILSYK